jgi:hypothetical protein
VIFSLTRREPFFVELFLALNSHSWKTFRHPQRCSDRDQSSAKIRPQTPVKLRFNLTLNWFPPEFRKLSQGKNVEIVF